MHSYRGVRYIRSRKRTFAWGGGTREEACEQAVQIMALRRVHRRACRQHGRRAGRGAVRTQRGEEALEVKVVVGRQGRGASCLHAGELGERLDRDAGCRKGADNGRTLKHRHGGALHRNGFGSRRGDAGLGCGSRARNRRRVRVGGDDLSWPADTRQCDGAELEFWLQRRRVNRVAGDRIDCQVIAEDVVPMEERKTVSRPDPIGDDGWQDRPSTGASGSLAFAQLFRKRRVRRGRQPRHVTARRHQCIELVRRPGAPLPSVRVNQWLRTLMHACGAIYLPGTSARDRTFDAVATHLAPIDAIDKRVKSTFRREPRAIDDSDRLTFDSDA
jgi:hypothetical protein